MTTTHPVRQQALRKMGYAQRRVSDGTARYVIVEAAYEADATQTERSLRALAPELADAGLTMITDSPARVSGRASSTATRTPVWPTPARSIESQETISSRSRSTASSPVTHTPGTAWNRNATGPAPWSGCVCECAAGFEQPPPDTFRPKSGDDAPSGPLRTRPRSMHHAKLPAL